MSELAAPLNNAVAVTKSDVTTYNPALKAFYVGGGGDVAVKTLGNHTVTFTAIPTGTVVRITVRQILSTGTGATNIVGFW